MFGIMPTLERLLEAIESLTDTLGGKKSVNNLYNVQLKSFNQLVEDNNNLRKQIEELEQRLSNAIFRTEVVAESRAYHSQKCMDLQKEVEALKSTFVPAELSAMLKSNARSIERIAALEGELRMVKKSLSDEEKAHAVAVEELRQYKRNGTLDPGLGLHMLISKKDSGLLQWCIRRALKWGGITSAETADLNFLQERLQQV